MGRTKHLFNIAGVLWLIPAITVLARSVNYSQVLSHNIVKHDQSVNQQRRPVRHEESEQFENSIIQHRNRRKRELGLEQHGTRILGFSVEYESDKKRVDHQEGAVQILEGLEVTLRLFGKFTDKTQFGYSKGRDCKSEEVIHEKVYSIFYFHYSLVING